MTPGILYLHGFCSSPASWKARILADALNARGRGDCFFCPALSHVPDEAIAVAEKIIRDSADSGYSLTLTGSSLGGFYATVLAERHDLRAVLLNPLAAVPRALEPLLGVQTNLYTGETFELTLEHIDQLETMNVASITPERYLLFVETGDELLDYHDATRRYAKARQHVMEGGDHTLTRFPEILPLLFDFCGL
jgi:predicted esterase YcpF (UPF0227 family)